jgi:hypothetical protein
MWRQRAGAVRVVKKVDIYVILSDSLSGLQMKLTWRFTALSAIATVLAPALIVSRSAAG